MLNNGQAVQHEAGKVGIDGGRGGRRGGHGIMTGAPEGGQDVVRDPTLERAGLGFAGTEDQGVKAGFGDDERAAT